MQSVAHSLRNSGATPGRAIPMRLCELAADAGQSLAPECVDWAALSAIAGDHSCSSREMVQTVRESTWILMVADIAAQLKVDLAAIPVSDNREVEGLRQRYATEEMKARRANALRTADTRIQRADRELRHPRGFQSRALHARPTRHAARPHRLRKAGAALRFGAQRGRRVFLVPHQRPAEGESPSQARSLRPRNGASSPARCCSTRRSPCTSWRTCTRLAMCPDPGATSRSAREPTISTM